MKCHVCGSKMESTITDLPFKVNNTTIIILKELPIYQCEGCSEYLIEDQVLEGIEKIIQNVDDSAELEIIKYAA